MKDAPSINEQILNHEISCKAWEHQERAKSYSEWLERIKVEMHLNLPITHIKIEKTHPRALGTYNFERNGIGVEHEICMNALHLDREEWDVVRTITHECIHYWEDVNGYKVGYEGSRKGYHSKYFIRKSDELGIPVSKWGQSLGIKKDGPFHQMLQKYEVDGTGIVFYDENNPTVEKRAPSKSFRTYPWKCSCNPPIFAWTAEKEFLATCGHCDVPFTKVPREKKAKS